MQKDKIVSKKISLFRVRNRRFQSNAHVVISIQCPEFGVELGEIRGNRRFCTAIAVNNRIKCASAGKNGEKQVRKCQKMGKNSYFCVKSGKKIGKIGLFQDMCFKNLRKLCAQMRKLLVWGKKGCKQILNGYYTKERSLCLAFYTGGISIVS